MNHSKSIILIALITIACNTSFGQCADSLNIYSFVHNGHLYDVVRENKTWTAASACAVNRNGYLAEINDLAEQNAIFNELTNNANIMASNTQNQFGTASIWLGGTDQSTEGNWIWDGNNDGIGTQFWSGGANGSPVGGLYTNWGTSPAEPDNSGGQDHLTIIIKPTAVNFGLWNDLISTNSLYYLIEYDNVTSVKGLDFNDNIRIYPNPFTDFITIVNTNSVAITQIDIFNLLGQKVTSLHPREISDIQLNVSSLGIGMYILNVQFENGKSMSQRIVK